MEDLYLDKQLLSAAHRLAAQMRDRSISLYLTGLAASGKTAVAGIISQLTSIPLVDSGLPFRLATYLCNTIPAVQTNLALFDRLLNAHSTHVVNGEFRVFSGAEDITSKLRSASIDQDVARIAGDNRLRELILKFLRSTTQPPSIVAARGATEPLTTGPLVQIELRTDFNERVRRRTKESEEPLTKVKRSMRERDERDMCGPAAYPSADYVDSTRLTLEETVARVIERAGERITRLYAFQSFRRQVISNWEAIGNPLINLAWENSAEFVAQKEQKLQIPTGHTKGRFLLHLSRFAVRELFGVLTDDKRLEWAPGSFPVSLDTAGLKPDLSLLHAEATRVAEERKQSLERFFSETAIPRQFMVPITPARVRRAGGALIAEDENGRTLERFVMKDASRELGIAIEVHLHYLGTPRNDTTHRLVLVEESTELPVLYVSFTANSRKYYEPLLWAAGLRMEEVAIAVRGYGSPRCPKNAMALFLRMACKRVADDYPHLKAILTDINPNWGYTGGSFREAGFRDIGLKHAATYFYGTEYASRRGIDGTRGHKLPIENRLPLVPTIVMLRGLSDATDHAIKTVANNGLYLIPRSMYDKK